MIELILSIHLVQVDVFHFWGGRKRGETKKGEKPRKINTRKKEEGRRKKEEGERRKKEEERRKKKEERRKKKEGGNNNREESKQIRWRTLRHPIGTSKPMPKSMRVNWDE